MKFIYFWLEICLISDSKTFKAIQILPHRRQGKVQVLFHTFLSEITDQMN